MSLVPTSPIVDMVHSQVKLPCHITALKVTSSKDTPGSPQKLVKLFYKKQTNWPVELWALKQEMETDDDHIIMRESF